MKEKVEVIRIGIARSEANLILKLIHEYKSRGIALTQDELDICESIEDILK